MNRLSRSLDAVVLWVRSNEENPETYFWRGKGDTADDICCFKSEAKPEPKSGWRLARSQSAALPACYDTSGPKSSGTFYFLVR